jgi:nuclear transport factor 2 (NTF2) superfamily protein
MWMRVLEKPALMMT